jgi:hypothetical protein
MFPLEILGPQMLETQGLPGSGELALHPCPTSRSTVTEVRNAYNYACQGSEA